MIVAIVEDEKYFNDMLIATLREWNVRKTDMVILPFYSGEEIVDQYRVDQSPFDIIFMDIRLGGISGIEASRRLRSLGYENEIVFTTNHTDFEYMQQSHIVRALNYFTKPVTVQNIEYCMDYLSRSRAYTYSFNGKRISVPYKEILCFESRKNYVGIITVFRDDKKLKFKSNMTSVIDQLPDVFVQCHRSYIVNMSHVLKIEEKDIYLRCEKTPLIIGDTFLDNVLQAFSRI